MAASCSSVTGMTFCLKTHGGGRRRAVVFFAGETQLKWLQWLKPGFRHCFIALNHEELWIVYNHLSHQTFLSVVADSSINEMIEWHMGKGWKVIRYAIKDAKAKPATFWPNTCVEAVKRVLGVQNRFIITPWQLYRHLCQQNMND